MAQTTEGTSVMVQGRIVWTSGDLFAGRDKTVFGTNEVAKDDKGQPIREYGFGLAVPKAAFGQVGVGQPGQIWNVMQEEARKLYPSGQIPPGFAWKYKDGDGQGVDDKGNVVQYGTREGHEGHIVFALTTRQPIKFFRFENGQNILINEGIKCGDYVNVQVNVKAQSSAKPGLYLNPNAVQFLGYGKEIVSAPSGDAIFGVAPPPLPQGASAMPLAPQPGQMLMPAPGAPVMPQQPQGWPQQAPAPVAPPAPHYGVVPAAFQPPPGGQPMGNVPQPGGWSAPAAGVIPSPVQMPPPTASTAVAPGGWPQAPAMPGMPGFPQQR